MDAYQLYSDLNFLNTALDAAYDILTPWGSDKIVYRVVPRIFAYCYVIVTISRVKWRTGFWPVA